MLTAPTEEQIVKVPDMAESITEGTLKQFNKQVGDYVEQDEEIATIETDKIDVAVNAPAAGTIKEFLANEEDTVTVGQDLVKLELGGEPGQKAEKGEEQPKEPASESQETSSQPQGQKESKKESKPEPPKQKEEPKPQPPKQKEETKSAPPKQKEEPSKIESPFGNREERRVKMNRMRLRIAERLKQSQNTAASLTTFNEVDMSALIDMRKKYKDDILKRTGIKFGFMSAFSRAAVLAMREVPAVNASIEGPGGGDTIVYRDYVDISVAVATEKGLVTPVVRNAESMDMLGIEKTIADLGKKVGWLQADSIFRNADLHRLATTSLPSKTWQEGLSPSATAVSLALSWEHRSSTFRKPLCWVCMLSMISQLPSTEKSRFDL